MRLAEEAILNDMKLLLGEIKYSAEMNTDKEVRKLLVEATAEEHEGETRLTVIQRNPSKRQRRDPLESLRSYEVRIHDQHH